MPLINVDAKSLEWNACVHLARDEQGKQEIEQNIDQHSVNQLFLKLPEGKEGRLVAKKFVFKLIYGAVADSFANDIEINHISKSPDFWESKINSFYSKYYGIERFHRNLVETFLTTHKIVMPTGRIYTFSNEEIQPSNRAYIRPKILNYPVQGFGNDIMTLVRVAIYRRLKTLRCEAKLISTIHDSIIIDSPQDDIEVVLNVIEKAWENLPTNYEWLTNKKDSLFVPFKYEITIGDNLKELKPYVNQN